MKIPSARLFWKLFGAFLFAVVASFFIGVTYVELAEPKVSLNTEELAGPMYVAEALEHQGLEPAIARMEAENLSGSVGIFDANDQWLAGSNDFSANASILKVIDPKGDEYRFRLRLLEPVNRNEAVLVFFGGLVSLIFSALVAWYLTRPISLLNQGFKAVAQGALSTRVHPLVGSRRDEIADLTREFDRMAGRLEGLIETQDRLLHDISHELRSPLARLEVAIGLLRQSPDKLPKMLERVQREAGRLDELIGEILTFARFKDAHSQLQFRPVNLTSLLGEIADDANFEVQAKDCSVSLNTAASYTVPGDREMLRRAIENIVRNAVKYAPSGTNVSIEAADRGTRIAIVVRDRGPGIEEDLLDTIFEPFNRGERASETSATGFGLGLAIAKHAIEKHSGTIKALSRRNGPGLAVEITLPKFNRT